MTKTQKRFLRYITEDTTKEEQGYWIDLLPFIPKNKMQEFINKVQPRNRKYLEKTNNLISRI